MGRDGRPVRAEFLSGSFNPRAPHGARPGRRQGTGQVTEFQSTRPAWGATADRLLQRARQISFNPRAPHGARPWCGRYKTPRPWFQSTRPAWGATSAVRFSFLALCLFQSTRPAWGATITAAALSASAVCFNPRAPHGARPINLDKFPAKSSFQSTRPAWGATRPVLLRPGLIRCFNPRAPHGARHATATSST